MIKKLSRNHLVAQLFGFIIICNLLAFVCPSYGAVIKSNKTKVYKNELMLVAKGQSSYRIVVPVNASDTEKKAALELQKYLKEISGTQLNIVTDAVSVSDKEIVLGRSTRLAAMRANIDYAKLGDDGFVIKTFGKKLVITANPGNGVLYGTYGFLEKYLGCRWYTSTACRIPKRSSISIGSINDLEVPSSKFREIVYWVNRDPDFAMQLKLSGPLRTNSLSELYDTGSPGEAKHPGWGLFCHGVYTLVPPQKYFDAHPEYYSLIDGQRRYTYNNQSAQLCMTNPDLPDVIAGELKVLMAQYPDDKYWDISQNDSGGNCQCAECKAVDEREGSPSGSILTLLNKVAAMFPDKTISTLAYGYGRKPPAHLKTAPNVLIQLCFLTQKRNPHPLNTSDLTGNSDIRKDMETWNRICNNILVWDYYSSCNHTLMPNPNLRILQPNIQYYMAHGASSIFPCVNGDRGVEFIELRNYMLAKLMWNSKADVNKLMKDFLTGYYGKAADPIRQYIDLMHNSSEASGMGLPIFSRPSEYRAGYLSPKLVEQYSRLFDIAESKAAGNAELLNRVQAARLPVMYIQLELSYGSIVDRKAIADKFFRIAERNNIVIVGDRQTLQRYRSTIMARLKRESSLLGAEEGSSKGTEITLSKSVHADNIVMELMGESQDIAGYTIDGFVDGAWRALCRGNHIGYRTIQPLIDGASPELVDSDWTSENLPHPAVTEEYFWAPYDTNVVMREPSPDKWYRKKIVLPESWNGQDVALQLGREGVAIDDDALCAVYFNGCRLSSGWIDLSRGEGLTDGDLRETLISAYGWFKPRNYYIPSRLVRPGQENCVAVWVADTGGQSGLYDGPIVLSAGGNKIDLAGEWKTGNPSDGQYSVSRLRIRCDDGSVPRLRRFAAYSRISSVNVTD